MRLLIFFFSITFQEHENLQKLARSLDFSIQKEDMPRVKIVAADLIKNGSREAIDILLSRLKTVNLRSYWLILESLTNVATRGSAKAIADEILAAPDMSYAGDLFEALRRTSIAEAYLVEIAKHKQSKIRIMAIDEMVRREKTEFISPLIELLASEEDSKSGDTLAVRRALRNLTELDFDAAAAWRHWWEKERSSFKLKEGEPLKEDTTIVHALKRNRRTQYEELKRGNKRGIFIVRSNCDKVEGVIDDISLPYTSVTLKNIAKGVLDPDNAFALLINCCPESTSGGVGGKRTLEIIRDFVQQGGHVFGMCNVLEILFRSIFGDYLKGSGVKNDGFIEIFPARGASAHPFMREVFPTFRGHTWYMESVSNGFRHDPQKVTLLVASPGIDPMGNSGGVAATFEYGAKGGHVLFLTSHFTRQKTKEDEFTLQNLLLNFLIEAQENWRARNGR